MRIGIVGLGLIGGSLAKALHPFGHTLIAFDTHNDSINLALQERVIDEGYVKVHPSLFSCEVIYLCLSPEASVQFLKDHAHEWQKNTLITDVAGLKKPYFPYVESLLEKGIEVVLGHPMAGREKSGYTGSTQTLFQNTNYLLMPQPKNTSKALEIISLLTRQLGVKTITRLTVEEHDQLMAYVSQLPHLMAAALLTSEDYSNSLPSLIGGSFKDLTRVGAMNEGLWSELFLSNKAQLIPVIEHFQSILDQFKEAIEKGDKATLSDLIRLSTKRRNDFHD